MANKRTAAICRRADAYARGVRQHWDIGSDVAEAIAIAWRCGHEAALSDVRRARNAANGAEEERDQLNAVLGGPRRMSR